MAPKLCPDCGTHHHPHQAHVFGIANSVANAISVANKSVANKRKAGKYKDPEKRRKYMREYMARKRAKKS